MTSTQTAIVFIGMFEGILKHMLTLFVCFWSYCSQHGTRPTQWMPIGCVGGQLSRCQLDVSKHECRCKIWIWQANKKMLTKKICKVFGLCWVRVKLNSTRITPGWLDEHSSYYQLVPARLQLTRLSNRDLSICDQPLIYMLSSLLGVIFSIIILLSSLFSLPLWYGHNSLDMYRQGAHEGINVL